MLIGDWGFATQWCAYRLKNRFYGSPMYISAEVLTKRSYVGPEIDMFSLGVVLYACLTGKVPFGPASRPEYRQKILEGRWAKLPCLTEEDCNLLTRMLDPNPLTRATPFEITKFVREYRQQKERQKQERESEAP